MASDSKSTVVKVRPSNQDSKGKLDSSIVNKKKAESSTKQPFDSKQKSVTTVTKTEVKSKTTSGSSKTATKKTTTTRVREKKVYTLPGQKFDPPEEREPLRIFYESLSKQIPTSEMAEFWMMEHGLLSHDKSKKAFEKKQRRQKEIRMGTPIKSAKLPSKPPSKPESSQRQQQASKNGNVKAKKRIIDESDDDDEFILSPKRRKW
ncbi:micronuclear linker histone polyprotein [Fagus crenata]